MRPGTAVWHDAELRERTRTAEPIDVAQVPGGGSALMARWMAA